MSINVGIVVLLCLVLILAMIRYRSSRAAGAGDEAAGSSAKRAPMKPSLRLGRASRTTEPEPPRQRRNRPRLGLTVSGVPTEEALLTTSPGADTTTDTHDSPEPSVEESDAAILKLAAGATMMEPAPPSTRDTVPDDATEQIPVALRGVVQEDAVIEAPGWPQPGELGLTSATDGFVAGVDEFDADVPDVSAPEAMVADEPLVAPADDLLAADVSAQTWDEDFAAFDSASGWGSADDDPAEPAADETDSGWEPAAPDATFDDAWAVSHDGEGNGEETFADDVSETAEDQDWSASEWDFAAVAAAPAIAFADESASEVQRDAPSATGREESTFSWPGGDVAFESGEDIDVDLVIPAREPVFADLPVADIAPSPVDVAVASVAEPAPWEPPAVESSDPLHDPEPEWTAPVTPAKAPKVDKRTRQLEKRLAAAEAELKRIAKRTKGKKGDLRKAGKDKIARQVRKAIGDPALAHHFDLEVGKGRFAFERRPGDLPVVTLGEHRVAGEGSELLTALEGPMRANLLAMLLRDYAHSEADRRVAAFRSPNGDALHDAGEFDALVARLAELSQGALLGIEPPRPTA